MGGGLVVVVPRHAAVVLNFPPRAMMGMGTASPGPLVSLSVPFSLSLSPVCLSAILSVYPSKVTLLLRPLAVEAYTRRNSVESGGRPRASRPRGLRAVMLTSSWCSGCVNT